MFDSITEFDSYALNKLAIFLEGYKVGKGDFEPLGEETLKSLWKAVTIFKAQSNINKSKKGC